MVKGYCNIFLKIYIISILIIYKINQIILKEYKLFIYNVYKKNCFTIKIWHNKNIII